MSLRTNLLKRLPLILSLLAIVAAIILGLWLKTLFFKEKPQTKKMVQQITVVAPPPPPPPPPPEMEEPEVEEEVIEEEIEEAPPEQGMDEPPGEELGLDADGAAGADGFGLVAKKGGSGFLGGGYHSTIQAEIQKRLLQDEELKFLAYEAVIQLWINDDGSFRKFTVELEGGDEKARRELERFLNDMAKVSKPKPLAEESDWFRYRFTSTI